MIFQFAIEVRCRQIFRQVTVPSARPLAPSSPAASLKSSQSHGLHSNPLLGIQKLISDSSSKPTCCSSPAQCPAEYKDGFLLGHLCSQQQTGGLRRSQSSSQVLLATGQTWVGLGALSYKILTKNAMLQNLENFLRLTHKAKLILFDKKASHKMMFQK